jgi:cob(I)alamin adenosyltransferase
MAGLVIVNTGNGKGKTTAAIGMAVRAWGQHLRPCVIQFIKSEESRTGEQKAAETMGIAWYQVGEGFVWYAAGATRSRKQAQRGWELAKQTIKAHIYDMVILDEFTYPLNFGWVDVNEAVAWFIHNKPADTHLVITGRDCPQALGDYADVVTDMRVVKHAFDEGVCAQLGVEY